MVESQEQNASRLSLLQRHREARERLVKLQGSAGPGGSFGPFDGPSDGPCEAAATAPPPPEERSEGRSSLQVGTAPLAKDAHPKSAAGHSRHSQEALSASVAAASSHFRSTPLQTPLQTPTSTGASNLPRKRPLSAFPLRATFSNASPASPVCQRPASAIGTRERFASAEASEAMPGQCHDAAALRRPSSGGAATLMEQLPNQGPDLLAAIQGRFGPPPPLPPLPPEPPEPPEPRNSKETPDESVLEDDDFTAEERRLEQECEEALNQLEALDAAVDALRLKLEVSKDDLESSGAELQQLRCAADSWAKAAEESRRELRDREQRLKELLAVLPVEEAVRPSSELEKDKEPPRQSVLADERVSVLAKQTDRLEEQVQSQQRLLAQRLDERRALEVQVEGLVRDRDEQKVLQQKARGTLRTTEAQLKLKEEELTTTSRRCQELQRHGVRMRGEVRGLKARLAACEPAGCTPSKGGSEISTEQEVQDAQEALQVPENETSLRGSGEQRRRVSLRLQHEVVELWKALRKCQEEAASLKGSSAAPD